MSSEIISLFQNDPTSLLSSSESTEKVLKLLKSIVDPVISKDQSVLDELFIEGLDSSQVWPQVKLVLDKLVEDLLFEKIPSHTGNYFNTEESEEENENLQELDEAKVETNSEEEEEEEKKEKEEEEGEEDVEGEAEEEGEEGTSINLDNLQDDYRESDIDEEKKDEEEKVSDAVSKDKYGLNDDFFSIEEFNKQILAHEGDRKFINGDDEDIDYFGEIPESDDEEILYFNDFFSKPKTNKKDFKSRKPAQMDSQTKSQNDQGDEDEKEGDNDDNEGDDFNEEDYDHGMKSAMLDLFDEEEEETPKLEPTLSSFERQQLQIQQEIAKLEKESIAEKRWSMKGESKAKDRPQDSLLEEELEFERNAKPVPVITRESTETLEELIRRRIKDGQFDDIAKRTINDLNNFRPSSSYELSEEKSSKSLAELYEDDYEGTTDSAQSEELSRSHDEIKSLFQSISHKLDALSSAHFIPKPLQKSIDIKVQTSTISMEDSTPLTLSNSSRLAPQEIYKSGNGNKKTEEIELKSGQVMSRSELSRDEKQRLRRSNKRKRSKEFKSQDKGDIKKSKKQDAIDTLSKSNNVTIIDNKGIKRDVRGNEKKDGGKKGTSSFKL
ncbi:hypothetical protein WICMUC_000545 [Wickerhamomyces mucosus]|uniref:U3 small nucleolar ribonucleoprotein protein MPP10 n=1 Tax=Wickerhamomyces mucosus TaxID=1378264 RepID=A0A9P8PZL4_9ASCO|nr:hypothetical protein WICMUC_000545 [Wickerhamomyces mucosus]